VKVYINQKEKGNGESFDIIIIMKTNSNTPDFRKITFQTKRQSPS